LTLRMQVKMRTAGNRRRPPFYEFMVIAGTYWPAPW
jgi:hypothetical protein